MPIPPEVGPSAMSDDELDLLDELAERASAAGQSLAEWVLNPGAQDPIDPAHWQPLERWRITDDGAAEWAMRMLALATTQVELAEASAQQWRLEVDDWLDTTTAKPRATVAYMQAQLQRYAIDRRKAGGSPTLNLPSGKVATRPTKDKIVITDAEKVLAWAKGLGRSVLDLVAPVKRTPMVSNLYEVVSLQHCEDGDVVPMDADGARVPGITVTPGGYSATVTPT